MQTCCGQPAYNSGDAPHARALAKRVIAAFEPYDYVVGPSGSCIGMLREHYPRIFPTDARWCGRAEALAPRCFELLSFLHDRLGVRSVDARHRARCTYHDTCSGLRELGVHGAPRALLASVDGLELVEMDDTEVCCGFGGTFCVKYPEISARLVSDKVRNACATGADTLLGGDLGSTSPAAPSARAGPFRSTMPRRCWPASATRRRSGARAEPAKPPAAHRTAPMQPRSRRFPDIARIELRNPNLQSAMGLAKRGFIGKREAAVAALPEFDRLRDVAREIKEHTLGHLDYYLEQFERRVEASGQTRRR